MASKKTNSDKSGMNTPIYGTVEKIPDGYTYKVGKDGVARLVPKKKETKKTK